MVVIFGEITVEVDDEMLVEMLIERLADEICTPEDTEFEIANVNRDSREGKTVFLLNGKKA